MYQFFIPYWVYSIGHVIFLKIHTFPSKKVINFFPIASSKVKFGYWILIIILPWVGIGDWFSCGVRDMQMVFVGAVFVEAVATITTTF